MPERERESEDTGVRDALEGTLDQAWLAGKPVMHPLQTGRDQWQIEKLAAGYV
jgi:hypothetical protein